MASSASFKRSNISRFSGLATECNVGWVKVELEPLVDDQPQEEEHSDAEQKIRDVHANLKRRMHQKARSASAVNKAYAMRSSGPGFNNVVINSSNISKQMAI